MPHPTTVDESMTDNYPIDDNDNDEPPPLEAEFPSPPPPVRNTRMPMLYRTRRGDIAGVNTASFDALWHSMRNTYAGSFVPFTATPQFDVSQVYPASQWYPTTVFDEPGSVEVSASTIARLVGNDGMVARRLFSANNDINNPRVMQWTQ